MGDESKPDQESPAPEWPCLIAGATALGCLLIKGLAAGGYERALWPLLLVFHAPFGLMVTGAAFMLDQDSEPAPDRRLIRGCLRGGFCGCLWGYLILSLSQRGPAEWAHPNTLEAIVPYAAVGAVAVMAAQSASMLAGVHRER